MIKNPRYDHVPEIRFFGPTNFKELGLTRNKEMYGLVKDIRKLEFLTRPQDYGSLFEEIFGM